MATEDTLAGAAREQDTPEEVVLVARGIATAVAPEEGLAEVQAALLQAVASALTGVEVDYHNLEPLGPEDLADVLSGKPLGYRQRIVHHMVLGELVLRPLPLPVAVRVARYAQALGVDDQFVRVARRYAQGAFGLAWMDLRRSGFTEHVRNADTEALRTKLVVNDPFTDRDHDPALEARWQAFQELPPGSLGRCVWEMYDGRGFALPGSPEGPTAYLAQHDFVHVLADYGTNLKGELEVFAFLGRADPDPKGFAWLATLIGLFETGYIEDTGFFERDVRERNIQAPGMHYRIADAIRRGKVVCESFGTDLFEVDYHDVADRPVPEVRAMLDLPAKSRACVESGSAGLFDLAGMSEAQQRAVAERERRNA
jgi:ubiquinone biosynthesis protein Coq4